MLGLLVRSLVAPWYLMVAVMTTFAASLGVGVLAVQVIGGGAGLIFFLPILLFLFVVAIGTDYNILMVARLREEMKAGAAPREAVARAVEHAGPAVAAAALIVAGTFSALLTARVGFLTQFGLTVAVGIVLAAVMALFLVPGLTGLIGRAAWWPGLRRGAPAEPVRRAEELPEAAALPPGY